jgi:hypothetical protein
LWVWARSTNHSKVESAPVEWLLLRTYRRHQQHGVKMLRRHHAKPQGGVRQIAMAPGEPFVGDEARLIDQHFAEIQFGLQIFRKDLKRRKNRLRR